MLQIVLVLKVYTRIYNVQRTTPPLKILFFFIQHNKVLYNNLLFTVQLLKQ